jgi:hypothetical protein
MNRNKRRLNMKQKPKIKADDVVPNNISLGTINYSCTIGSFDVGVRELAEIGLNCLKRMKEIERER